MTTKILLVDDDEFIRALTQEMLEQCGFEVEAAQDGLQAWQLIDAQPQRFDLMLLDKQMPKMDGIALLKKMKSTGRFSELPVILLTGANQQQDVLQGLSEGAAYYLTKPSSEEVLKLVIENVLGESRKKRELHALIGRQANNLNLIRRAEFRFRTLREARDLALLLADVSMDPDRTVNGYAELLINAVEHGNLGITYAEKSVLMTLDRWEAEVASRLASAQYSSCWVTVNLEKTSDSLIVAIADQGDGFDWHSYVEFSPERVFDLHGRGIAMSKAMSFDRLEYLANGSTVVTTVKLPPQ